jgi:hypothetical protein
MMSRVFTSRWQKPVARLAIGVLMLLPLVFYKGWGEPRPSRSLLAQGLSSWGDHARSQISTYTTNYDYEYHPYLGKWINEHLPRTTRIVYEQMGQVPYFAGIDYHFMDLGGLTDRYIADCYRDSRPSAFCTFVVQALDQITLGRAKGLVSRLQSLCARGNPDAMQEIVRYVLSHQPEVIMVTGLISQWRPWQDLWSDPSFRNRYILTDVFGYCPGAYPEFTENFDIETLNTIIFFRRDFKAADFSDHKYGFDGVAHNRFCHYSQQGEVGGWIGRKYPHLLPITR